MRVADFNRSDQESNARKIEISNRNARRKDQFIKFMKKGIAAVLASTMVLSGFPFDGALLGETTDVYAASSTDSNPFKTTDTEKGGTVFNLNSEDGSSGNGSGSEDSTGVGLGYDTSTESGYSSGEYEVTEGTTATPQDAYKVSANANKETFKAFADMEEWKNRTIFDAPERTYSLTVATGATDGSQVLYYAVRYKDKDNVSRTQFIFPHVDAFQKSADLLNYYAKGSDIYATFGSKMAKQMNYKESSVKQNALQAFSVQDYAFQTEAEIKSIESIDVYIEVGSWTVQGLSVYKVNKYKGMEEYGIVSGQTFLDFEGYMIADAKKQDPSEQLTLPEGTAGTDSITRINLDATKSIYLENYTEVTEENKKDYAVNSSLYSLRMDFSDYYEGGLEMFLNGKADSMKAYGGIVEDMVMELQYKDIHGWTRKVYIPVILNSYGQAMQSLGDKTIMGFAQRGDTIAFQGLFPDFDSIMGNPVIYVGDKARSLISNYGINTASSTSKMNSNLSASSSDDVRIAGVSFYKGGCMPYISDGIDTEGNTLEGATIQYVFENEDNPMYYQTTDQVKGRQIKSNGSETFKMSKYKSGAPIVGARKGQDMFLVTVSTSSKAKTDASSDMSIKLYYNTIDGQQTNTMLYKAKEGANDYMGVWPDVNNGNFLNNASLSPGGEVSFLIEAKDFQNFTAAELTVLGGNDWVMDNITVSYVQTYNSRLSYIKETESAGVKSHFWIERSAVTSQFFNLKGIDYKVLDASGKDVNDAGDVTVDANGKVQLVIDGVPQYDEDNNPILVDYSEVEHKKTTGDQVFKPGSPYKITFNDSSIVDVRETTYADVRYSMTWAQAKMDWGFFREKKKYDVAVQVAADKDYDDGNGNSGSKNNFYFQLLFRNGNSAYVLANQQLSADGFRSGREETFSISVNQDYGDLRGLRIIPEDVTDDSTPFDKLNIQSISVSEQTRGGSFISYVFDQVGWIEIDYRDELESASSHGQHARTEQELSKVYKYSYKERNVKLLCEVVYEPWSGNYEQFAGSIKAVIKYVTASDNKNKEKVIDVAQCMASYQNVAANSVEPAEGENGVQKVSAAGMGTYTDPKIMMRPNHTDRFIIPSISDLKSIKSITFTAKNAGEGTSIWNIGSVSISQVISDGDLKLTENDEYVRDMTTKHLCMNAKPGVVSTELEVGEAKQVETIDMTYNELVWSSEEWATPVTRVPDSEDDTVDVYVYPTADSSTPETADFLAKLNYYVPFSQYKTASADSFKHYTDSNGKLVYFKQGIKASGFVNASSLKLRSFSANMKIDHAVVQHVKEGTVIGTYTYYFNGAPASDFPKAEPLFNNDFLDHCREVVALSFGPGTPAQELIAEGHDIAIGFTYRSTIDDGETEFHSPYVYLTDVNINEISEGLFAEVPFDIPYVKQITGYQIAGYGNLEGTIIGAAAQVYGVDKKGVETKRSFASFAEDKYSITSRLENHKATSDVPYSDDVRRSTTPVSITFKTSDASKDTDSSTNSAVRMYVKYAKFDGTSPTEPLFEDVTPYIQGDVKRFVTGEEQTVKFFLQGMSQNLSIISLYIVPYNSKVEITNEKAQVPQSEKDYSTVETILNEAGDGEGVDLNNQNAADMTKEILESRNAFWRIDSVSVDIGFGERVVSRDKLDQEFSGLSTNNTLRLTNVKEVIDITKNSEAKRTIESGTVLSYTAKSGDKFTGHVFVVDSESGFEAKAYRVVGTAKEEVSGSITDVKADSFVFTVPENKTGELVVYRLEIYPKDGPDLIEVVEITVESDPVENASSTDAKTDQP